MKQGHRSLLTIQDLLYVVYLVSKYLHPRTGTRLALEDRADEAEVEVEGGVGVGMKSSRFKNLVIVYTVYIVLIYYYGNSIQLFKRRGMECSRAVHNDQ